MKLLSAGLLTALVILILAFLSGFWVRKSGKPYPMLIFTIHKLLALAAAVFSFLEIRKWLAIMDVQAMMIYLIVIVMILVIGLFATGAIMSFDKPSPRAARAYHLGAPFLLVLTLGLIVYIVLV